MVLNYVCACVLLCAAAYLAWTCGARGARGVATELGMALGYALGGLVHGRYPNRAVADRCAHRFFYPAFAGSYLAMVASCAAWSGAPPRGPRAHDAALRAVRAALAMSGGLVLAGAAGCQLGGAELVPTRLDACAPGHPLCDRVMLAGEGVFYVAWIAAWAVAAARAAPGLSERARRHNVASVAWLLLGPGQIVAVCAAPLLFLDARRAGDVSMRLYCRLRTGVTYILAVLLSHLHTSAVSAALFARKRHPGDGRVAFSPLVAEADAGFTEASSDSDEGDDEDGPALALRRLP